MTKEETVKIMAVLGAFYAGGKNDPKQQATAWHMILAKYDFDVALQAVLHYAENDTREYATFPTVGNIVKAIKDEICRRKKPIDEVIISISYGRNYAMLSKEAKALIPEDKYNTWLEVDAMYFAENAQSYTDELKGMRLLNGRNQ